MPDLITAKIAANMMKKDLNGTALGEKIDEAKELLNELPGNLPFVPKDTSNQKQIEILTVDDIDRTLTDQNKVAPADIVGKLQGELNELDELVNGKKYKITYIKGEYVETDGTITPYNDNWSRTDYLDATVFGGRLNYKNSGDGTQYNAFYRADKTFIKQFTIYNSQTGGIPIPEDAKYFIISNKTEQLPLITFDDIPAPQGGLLSDIAEKLTQPEAAQVGQYLRVASIDDDGHAVLETVDVPSAEKEWVSYPLTLNSATPIDFTGCTKMIISCTLTWKQKTETPSTLLVKVGPYSPIALELTPGFAAVIFFDINIMNKVGIYPNSSIVSEIPYDGNMNTRYFPFAINNASVSTTLITSIELMSDDDNLKTANKPAVYIK